MRRGFLLVLLSICITIILPITAYALQSSKQANTISMDFSSGNIDCSASCSGTYSSDVLVATLTLYEDNFSVKSWSKTRNGYVSLGGNYTNPIHGKTYRLTLTWSLNGSSQTPLSTENTY